CRFQCMFFFFFSSRRRHTRFSRDWSSDVCSSTFGHVSLDSDVPVLVLRVPAGEEPRFGPIDRIVVPLDGSATAAQAIPLASRLARMGNLPVQFVMVIDPSRVIPAAYAYDPEA